MHSASVPTGEITAEVHLGDLRRAVRRGDLEAARAILDVEPRFSYAVSMGDGSLLLEAQEREHTAVAELFLTTRARSGGEDLDIHEACALRRPGAVRRAITDDPLAYESAGPAGFLPLHRAAFAGDPESVLLLLETGADASARSQNGARLTPLHSAVAGAARSDRHDAYREVVRLLLLGGADLTATMEGDWTPLAAAERDGVAALLAGLPGAAAGSNASDLAP